MADSPNQPHPVITRAFSSDDIKKWTSDEVTAAYLGMLKTSLSSNPDDSVQLLKDLNPPDNVGYVRVSTERFVSSQVAAFGKDVISLPKLLELVVGPFLNIARQINQGSTGAPAETAAVKKQRDLRDALLGGWEDGLEVLLDGGLLGNGDAEGPLVFIPLVTANQQALVLKAMMETHFFQSLVDLLEAPTPRVGMSVTKALQSLLHSQRKPGASVSVIPPVNKSMCLALLKDEPAMTQLLTFLIGHSTTRPSSEWTDLEWVAARGREVFDTLFHSVPEWKWCINRNQRHMGPSAPIPRVMYMSSFPGLGCPAVVIDPEWDPKMQVLQDHCDIRISVLGRGLPYSRADMRAALLRIVALDNVEMVALSPRPNPPKTRTAELACNFCDKPAAAGGARLPRCSGCNGVHYCNRACQAADWPRHKHVCKKFAARAAEAAAEAAAEPKFPAAGERVAPPPQPPAAAASAAGSEAGAAGAETETESAAAGAPPLPAAVASEAASKA